MKIKIESGYEFEVEKFDLNEVLKKCLVLEFGSEEDCLKYWGEDGLRVILKGEGLNEVVKYILEINESDRKNEYWDGEWVMSEEGFVKIFVDGELFLS
jgi:hypothetical protein